MSQHLRLETQNLSKSLKVRGRRNGRGSAHDYVVEDEEKSEEVDQMEERKKWERAGNGRFYGCFEM